MPTGAGWTRAYSRAWLGGVSMVGAGGWFPGEGAGRTMGAGRAGRGRQVQDAPPTCGQLLQRYRVLAGLTQEELASLAGTTRPTINQILREEQRRGTLELRRGRTVIVDRAEIVRRAR